MAKEASDYVLYQGMQWTRDEMRDTEIKAQEFRREAAAFIKRAENREELVTELRKAFAEADEAHKKPVLLVWTHGQATRTRVDDLNAMLVYQGRVFRLVGVEVLQEQAVSGVYLQEKNS